VFVKCIRPFGELSVGQVVEVPDGSEVSEHFFAPVTDLPAPGPITPPVA
jgi:hypothetical protein